MRPDQFIIDCHINFQSTLLSKGHIGLSIVIKKITGEVWEGKQFHIFGIKSDVRKITHILQLLRLSIFNCASVHMSVTVVK